MRKLTLLTFMAWGLTVFVLFLSFVGYANDDLGREIPSRVERIISLSPAVTEILFEIGAGSKLVGVSDFSDFPEAAKKLPSVGPYNKPSIEKLISLKPDLVILPMEGPQEVQAQMERLKIPFAVIKMRTLSEVSQAILKLAQWVDLESKGIEVKKHFDSDLATESGPSTELRVMVQVDHEPLMVAGGGNFLSEMVERCGAKNIFENIQGYPKVSRELVLEKKADVIIVAEHVSEPSRYKTIQNYWTKLVGSKIKVASVDPNLVSRPGPRLVKGLRQVCLALKR